MLTVDQRERIRRSYYVDGWSIRRIAREGHWDRRTIRKALRDAGPPRYTLRGNSGDTTLNSYSRSDSRFRPPRRHHRSFRVVKISVVAPQFKLWALRKNEAGEIEAEALSMVSSEPAENDLEELLVKSPSLLMPNLRLIGRQTPTVGGPLDLLGVDENGKLVVFELKRGVLYRQAVTQVIDYASSLAVLSRHELVSRIQQSSGYGGIDKIDDFDAWYQQEHAGSESVARPKMVLVGIPGTPHLIHFHVQTAPSGHLADATVALLL